MDAKAKFYEVKIKKIEIQQKEAEEQHLMHQECMRVLAAKNYQQNLTLKAAVDAMNIFQQKQQNDAERMAKDLDSLLRTKLTLE